MAESAGRRVVVVEDDTSTAQVLSEVLTSAGFSPRVFTDGLAAYGEILRSPPELLLLDLMVPGIDGIELCTRVRGEPALRGLKVLVLSGKMYDADRVAALRAGADGFLTKPVRIASLLEAIDRITADAAEVCFWGVRGTLPAPAKGNERYGGNTSCVSLHLPREGLLIFDAGTGIRALGDHLLRTTGGRISGAVLITHPHWDHINALPFFGPLFGQGNQFEILGPAQGARGMRELVAAQMDGLFFPITPRELGADLHYRELRPGTTEVQGVEVRCFSLMHPGACLGYRVELGRRSFAYITDHELFPEDSAWYSVEYRDRLVAFLRGVDLLVTDTSYFDEEYATRIGWGHSSVSAVAQLAHDAEVGSWALFHHDPGQSDADIDRKLRVAEAALRALGSSTRAFAPAEGDRVTL
ncbi:MAG: hypothetical protein RL071_4730 [Pseudomonadota bacterium]|jgi:CheY-like chemotaxis protein/phosphoribosyl 1,2-cyclic phosphodiesterase